VIQVTLPRLPRRQAAEMTARVAHGKARPPEVVEQVVAKTDGVPLFVERVYARARALCQQVGDTRQLFPVRWRLFYWQQVWGQLQRARGVGEELLGVAQQLQDLGMLVVAHRAQGNAAEWGSALAAQGTWAERLAQRREGLAAYRVSARIPWLLFLGLRAEACGRAG